MPTDVHPAQLIGETRETLRRWSREMELGVREETSMWEAGRRLGVSRQRVADVRQMDDLWWPGLGRPSQNGRDKGLDGGDGS